MIIKNNIFTSYLSHSYHKNWINVSRCTPLKKTFFKVKKKNWTNSADFWHWKWYFVTKIVLTYILWEKIVLVIVLFSDQEKLLKFEAEGREFAKILRSLEQFIQTVKVQNNFGNRMLFLTCSWRFLKSNTLEQLEFKLE